MQQTKLLCKGSFTRCCFLRPARGSLFVFFLLLFGQSHAQGTWVSLKNPAPDSCGSGMALLTDGRVICKTISGPGLGTGWDMLTPDIHGSYANGTWSTIASMNSDRLFFSTQVMPDGRVYVAGGEDGSGNSNGEIYDPIANTWTFCGNIPAGWKILDANSELLCDGTILEGVVYPSSYTTTDNLIYNPGTNAFDSAARSLHNHGETTWIKLPDSSVLYVDDSLQSSERYIPKMHQWISDANVPVPLYGEDETGPAFLLPDGRAFFIGDVQYTAYYTPSGNLTKGTWAQGPAMPSRAYCGQLGGTDVCGAMMVNGNIICELSPVYTSTTLEYFYEFNYLTNTFTSVKTPWGIDSSTIFSNDFVMLDLPDGTVLMSNYHTNRYYIYKPGSPPISAGKPTIDNIYKINCTTYKITGKLFNGITEGASYGDDFQTATNYPIIRLTDGTNVYYARTFNWNRIGAVMTDSLEDTVEFTIPATLPLGTYSLVVTANGNPSNPILLSPCGTGIEEVENKHSAEIYPNPNNGQFTIQIPNSQQLTANGSVEIYNMLGEKVYSRPFTTYHSPLTIDLGSQPNGIYMYRVVSETGNLVSDGKFIVEK